MLLPTSYLARFNCVRSVTAPLTFSRKMRSGGVENQRLKFLRTEDGTDVFMDIKTGKELEMERVGVLPTAEGHCHSNCRSHCTPWPVAWRDEADFV